ncbi:MAG: hypothetical protein ACI9MC_000671 [Kiritimatiellia bacterium]|jgi:hypothetical protein
MAPNDPADLNVDKSAAPAPLDVQMEVQVLAMDAIPLPSDDIDADDANDLSGDDGAQPSAVMSGDGGTDATAQETTAADEASAQQDDPEDHERPTEVDNSDENALVATTTEQAEPTMGKISGGWGYVYAAYGVTWACLALYVAYLVIYRRMQSTGGNS